MGKADPVEYEKRIRIVQEWILEGWPSCDMVAQIIMKWGVVERQAKRYIAEGRKRWVEEDDLKLEYKRRIKIAELRKRQRSLRDQFKGTPQGLNALNHIEKLIIKIDGLDMPKQHIIKGDKVNPIPINVVGKITHNLVVKRCTE